MIVPRIDSTTNTLNYDVIEQYVFTSYVFPPVAMYRISKFKLQYQSHVISTAEWNNVKSQPPVEERHILINRQRRSYLIGRLKNAVSRRADEERRISLYVGHVLTVKALRYDNINGLV